MRSKRHGLTVLELVLALGILGALLLSLLAFIVGILRATSKQDDLMVGTVVAQRQLDRAVLEGTYANTVSNNIQEAYTHDSASQTTFVYSVSSTAIPLPVPSTRSAYFVEVEVSWWGGTSGGPNRAGMGKLTTKLSRLVTPP